MAATRPRRLPTAIVATAATCALAAATLVGCSLASPTTPDDQPRRDDDGLIVEPNSQTDAFAVQVGDCLDDAALIGEVRTVATVACSDPHDSEIYASHELQQSPFPGLDAIVVQAEALCRSSFDTFVGEPYLQSPYAFTFYHPTQPSWVSGDREVLCVIYDPSGPVTGSLKGVIGER